MLEKSCQNLAQTRKNCPKLTQNSVKISKVTKDTKVRKSIENHGILLDNNYTYAALV